MNRGRWCSQNDLGSAMTFSSLGGWAENETYRVVPGLHELSGENRQMCTFIVSKRGRWIRFDRNRSLTLCWIPCAVTCIWLYRKEITREPKAGSPQTGKDRQKRALVLVARAHGCGSCDCSCSHKLLREEISDEFRQPIARKVKTGVRTHVWRRQASQPIAFGQNGTNKRWLRGQPMSAISAGI